MEHPDTRLQFFECIKTLKGLLVRDMDKDARAEVKEIVDSIDELKQSYIDMEQEAWDEIHPNIRKNNSAWQNRWTHIKGTLNTDMPWYEKWLQESLPIYRELLERLEIALNWLQYFKATLTED